MSLSVDEGLRKTQRHANGELSQEQINELTALYNQGRLQEALAQGEVLSRRFPDAPFIPNLLGAVNLGLGRLEQAVASFKRALLIKPDFAEAHNNLGNALSDLGRAEEAVASFNSALSIKPDFAEAHSNLGAILNYIGKPDEAVISYDKALLIKPRFAEAHRHLSIIKTYREGDPQIDQMLQLVEDHDLSDKDRMHLSFALGKAYDDIGALDKAFSHFIVGNRLRKEALRYEISADRASFAAIKHAFSEHVPTLDIEKNDEGTFGPRPVFIVGMPRSGTTLVEQILGSHSRVFAGGEREFLHRAINAIESDSIRISPGQLRSVRESYLSGLAKLNASEPVITDKMPTNFRYIGFILAAMPEARVVHVRRDARATCWSNFKHYFARRGTGFANDLKDLPEYYRMYADLMDFWRARFPGRIYDLDYEALTEQQEDETRKLLAHVGLDWEDQCLEFYKSRQLVRTASAAQVRQRMYRGSSEAWRKYEKHLGPMLELLRDL